MLHQSQSIHGDALNELCPRHSPRPVFSLLSLTDITLTRTMLQLDQPLVFFYNRRMHFSKNHQETLRNKIQYSQVPEVTQHAQKSHSEVTRREKNREREGLGLSLPLLQSEGEISRVSWVHYLLANLKHKYRMGRGKRDSNSSLGSFKQLSRLPWGSERGTFMVMGVPSSLSGCFCWQLCHSAALCLDRWLSKSAIKSLVSNTYTIPKYVQGTHKGKEATGLQLQNPCY